MECTNIIERQLLGIEIKDRQKYLIVGHSYVIVGHSYTTVENSYVMV